MNQTSSAPPLNDALAKLFDGDDVRLLMELSLAAAARGEVTPTDAIAKGLGRLRPRNVSPTAARALALICRGHADTAVDVMRSAPAGVDDEDRCFAEGMLAMALHAAGRRHDAWHVAQASAAKSDGWLARAVIAARSRSGAEA